MIILSGDIGGTNTRLVLIEFKNNKQKILAKKTYPCVEFQSFTEIIKRFLKEFSYAVTKIESVCFAIAGPIIHGRVKFTNLPWIIDLKQLQEDFRIEKIALINDFQAIGYGIETLGVKDLYILQKGRPVKNGVRVVVGAGTGLGVGFMYWNGTQYVVNPTEAGHVSFAPEDDVQMEILKFLRRKYHRVSNERLLSGDGIVHIYTYFLNLDIFHEMENPALRLAMHQGDPAAAITKFALFEHDPLALQAVDAFLRIYGSSVGDLAYSYLPYGGLYVAGGIAPKLIEQIADGRFMRSFTDKGRLSRILKDIPVQVVLNTDVGLQGAALLASRL